MKIIILAFLIALTLSPAEAQNEKATTRNIADKFQAFYNQRNADSLFALFSPEMKAALPLGKTHEIIEDLHNQAGRIEQREFLRYTNSYAVYKAKFERVILTLNISLDNSSHINGLFVKPFVPDSLPQIERNSSLLALPFDGEWFVFWGGDTKEQNYHIESKAQKNAFDFLIKDKQGKTYRTDGKSNEDYYCFGRQILAPTDGEIVLAVDGVKDNNPGDMNPVFVPGNTVIIKTEKNEFLFFAHFKNHTVSVKEGQKVRKGQLLGLCGNTGNSSEPHLHFHIQNVENMITATGVKCFFERIKVNGQIKTDYSPVQGDIISNIK